MNAHHSLPFAAIQHSPTTDHEPPPIGGSGYTDWSAYAEFQEQEKGSVAAGKLADMALLADDIFAIPGAQLKDVKVVATWLNGRQVHGQP